MKPHIIPSLSRFYLMSLLLAVSGIDASAQNPLPRIDCVVTGERRTRIEGGDWDDKTQRAAFQIIVTNKSLSKPTGPLQMTFYAFAASVHDRKAFKLVQKETYDFSLEAKATFQQKTPTVELKFDTTSASFGEAMRGWMLQIMDDEGRIVLEQCSTPLIADSKNLSSLEVGKFYNKDAQNISEPVGKMR